MYDDYDLDYTYTNDHAQDLDEIYDYMMHTYAQQLDEDLDDEYARDTHDYADLRTNIMHDIMHTHTHI